MLFRLLALVCALFAAGCTQTLFNRQTPVARPFPSPRPFTEATERREAPRATSRTEVTPPEPYREPSPRFTAPSPSAPAPAGERVFHLKRGQGITQALVEQGCDPKMLADAIARSRIGLSELNRLPIGKEIRVAEPCTTASAQTAHLSQVIQDATRNGRRNSGRIAALQRELAEARRRTTEAESEAEEAENARAAAENAKLGAEANLGALKERVKALGGKPTFEESLAALENAVGRLIKGTNTRNLEAALAEAEVRFTRTFRRWPWLFLGLFVGLAIALTIAYFLYKDRPRTKTVYATTRDELLGEDNYRELDEVVIISKVPRGYNNEYVYHHHAADPAGPAHERVAYYEHTLCGAKNIKGEERNLRDHFDNCPKRSERLAFTSQPSPVRT